VSSSPGQKSISNEAGSLGVASKEFLPGPRLKTAGRKRTSVSLPPSWPPEYGNLAAE
jgi:hypothetical protein